MSNDTPVMNLGPFQFHMTNVQTMRIVPLLPDNPTFADLRQAIITLNTEDILIARLKARECEERRLAAAMSDNPYRKEELTRASK